MRLGDQRKRASMLEKNTIEIGKKQSLLKHLSEKSDFEPENDAPGRKQSFWEHDHFPGPAVRLRGEVYNLAKSTSSNRKTYTNGGFSIVILIYPSVFLISCFPPFLHLKKNHRGGTFFSVLFLGSRITVFFAVSNALEVHCLKCLGGEI